MSDKERFKGFFDEFGIDNSAVTPQEVVIEMDDEVEWESALSVGQLWFLFGKDKEYLGLLLRGASNSLHFMLLHN